MILPSFMFDTNIFNRILDGVVDVAILRGKGHFYATHVQLDELRNTSNTQRRQELIAVFEEVTGSKVPTESFVLGVSRLDEAKMSGDSIVPTESAAWDVSAWDQAKWGDENGLYSAIKSELDKLNNNKPNNIQDALIAETAIKNRFALVTEDTDLSKVARKFGGKCADVNQMVAELGGKDAT